MPTRTEFSEKQPEYRYFPLNNGYADVFIYKFIEELTNEEDGSVSYVYEMNEFRVKQDEITEEMVKNNPLKWIDYKKIEYSDKERIEALEDALNSLILNGVEV